MEQRFSYRIYSVTGGVGLLILHVRSKHVHIWRIMFFQVFLLWTMDGSGVPDFLVPPTLIAYKRA